jgi:hypothetical protein
MSFISPPGPGMATGRVIRAPPISLQLMDLCRPTEGAR